jgi:hypothetical protein
VLLAGVKQGGQNFHSVDALMALATEAQAAVDNKTSFTVQMMGEVDGVTNGPMLTHLLLGAAATAKDLFGLLNRGGFFEQGNPSTQYNVWREAAGNLDLYERTALNMTAAAQKLAQIGVFSAKGKKIMDAKTAAMVMNAIYAFTGNLTDGNGNVEKAGRNIIKTPYKKK